MSISNTLVSVATTWIPSEHACRAQKESGAFSASLLGFQVASAPVSCLYHSIKILAQRKFHLLLCRRRVGTWCEKPNWKVGDHVNVLDLWASPH